MTVLERRVPKVLILGATGMLGTAVVREFLGFGFAVIGTVRPGRACDEMEFDKIEFDAQFDLIGSVTIGMGPGDFLVNCIGLIKTEIIDTDAASRGRAIHVNSALPASIAIDAEQRGYKVIQIATDCVFKGDKGSYREDSDHDPKDVYGKTKSLGEVISPNLMHLRVSIIGPESRGFTSLYEWVARQPHHAKITGYANHFWNGIPSKHFAKIARGIVENNLFRSGTYHVVPGDEVSKAELVKMIAKRASRLDIRIETGNSPTTVNRTLSTLHNDFNLALWRGAGYEWPPSIDQLVAEI